MFNFVTTAVVDGFLSVSLADDCSLYADPTGRHPSDVAVVNLSANFNGGQVSSQAELYFHSRRTGEFGGRCDIWCENGRERSCTLSGVAL